MKRGILFAAALLLAACGQSTTTTAPPGELTEAPNALEETAGVQAPPVDAVLLAAPTSAFVAVEPSEVGISAAETIAQAIEPLASPETAEGADLHVSVKEEGDNATADIVRSGLADDAIGSAHVRIEFIRSPEGWYPTNAYRRWQCRRAPDPAAWSATPCP
jgi:hypothetical protein